MKKIITLIIVLLYEQVNSQAYQLEYKCKEDFNDTQYTFIQKYDEEKYAYTIEQKERGLGSSSDKIYTVKVYLDPETLQYEKVEFPQGREYFLSSLSWYNSIVKDANYKEDFVYTPQNQKKETSIKYNTNSIKVSVEEYLLQNAAHTKDYYKVSFIKDNIIPIPMVYSKKNFYPEWTMMFYAYKNSNMEDIIYSFEELGTTSPKKCQLYKIQEFSKF